MIRCKNCGAQNPDGAAFCKKCGKKIVKVPIHKRWWFWVIIVFIALCFLPTGSETEEPEETTAEETTAPETTTEKSEEYLAISVNELIKALETNAMNAKDDYNGKLVEITGRCDVIDASGKYISLYADDSIWSMLNVQCYIKNKDQREFVKSIVQGESVVTLRGKITDVGEIMGYSLDIHEFVQ